MRYAIIKDGVVINTVNADDGIAEAIAAQSEGIAVQSEEAGVGHTYADGVFTAPYVAPPVVLPPAKRKLSKLAFINLFTDAEYETILAAAKQSVQVEAWVEKFRMTSVDPDGGSIDMEDPRTIGGIQTLEAAGILGAGRAAQILVPVK
jgi:hypothetical protein